jgi:transcription-repair coupling factor (superfamily II helicase)
MTTQPPITNNSDAGDSLSPIATRVIGVPDSAASYFLASLNDKHPQMLIVTPNRKLCEEIYRDLCFFLGEETVVLCPSWDTLPLEPGSPNTEISAERIKIFHQLYNQKSGVVVVSAETLQQRIIPPKDIQALSFNLKTGEPSNREKLVEKLLNAGFSPAKAVYDTGEFSLKGAVIDIFPSTTTEPVRIEFENEAIKQIRHFDKDTQRSSHSLNAVTILPVKEFSLHIKLILLRGVNFFTKFLC